MEAVRQVLFLFFLVSIHCYDNIFTLDCSGRVHILPESPLAIRADISPVKKLFDAALNLIRSRVEDNCGMLDDETFLSRFSPIDVLLARATGYHENNRNRYRGCLDSAEEFTRDLDKLFVHLFGDTWFQMPSTCNYEAFQRGHPCAFTVNMVGAHNSHLDLKIAINKCPNSNLPYIGIHCAGGACSTGKFCVNDDDCPSTLRCTPVLEYFGLGENDLVDFLADVFFVYNRGSEFTTDHCANMYSPRKLLYSLMFRLGNLFMSDDKLTPSVSMCLPPESIVLEAKDWEGKWRVHKYPREEQCPSLLSRRIFTIDKRLQPLIEWELGAEGHHIDTLILMGQNFPSMPAKTYYPDDDSIISLGCGGDLNIFGNAAYGIHVHFVHMNKILQAFASQIDEVWVCRQDLSLRMFRMMNEVWNLDLWTRGFFMQVGDPFVPLVDCFYRLLFDPEYQPSDFWKQAFKYPLEREQANTFHHNPLMMNGGVKLEPVETCSYSTWGWNNTCALGYDLNKELYDDSFQLRFRAKRCRNIPDAIPHMELSCRGTQCQHWLVQRLPCTNNGDCHEGNVCSPLTPRHWVDPLGTLLWGFDSKCPFAELNFSTPLPAGKGRGGHQWDRDQRYLYHLFTGVNTTDVYPNKLSVCQPIKGIEHTLKRSEFVQGAAKLVGLHPLVDSFIDPTVLFFRLKKSNRWPQGSSARWLRHLSDLTSIHTANMLIVSYIPPSEHAEGAVALSLVDMPNPAQAAMLFEAQLEHIRTSELDIVAFSCVSNCPQKLSSYGVGSAMWFYSAVVVAFGIAVALIVIAFYVYRILQSLPATDMTPMQMRARQEESQQNEREKTGLLAPDDDPDDDDNSGAGIPLQPIGMPSASPGGARCAPPKEKDKEETDDENDFTLEMDAPIIQHHHFPVHKLERGETESSVVSAVLDTLTNKTKETTEDPQPPDNDFPLD